MVNEDPPDWFKLEKYSGTQRLDFQGWRQQLESRVFLEGLLKSGSTEAFDRQFDEIKSSPFYDLGYESKFVSKRAVYPLTFGAASSLVYPLAGMGAQRYDPCDETLDMPQDSPPSLHAHLTVDLSASDAQLSDHFKEIIKTIRDRQKQFHPRTRGPAISLAVLKSWHEFKMLPFIDLTLFYNRSAIQLPSHTVLSTWLFLDGKGDKDKMRDTSKKAAEALRFTTVRQLALAE